MNETYSAELSHQEIDLNASHSFIQPARLPLAQDYPYNFQQVFRPAVNSDELSEAETPSHLHEFNSLNATFCAVDQLHSPRPHSSDHKTRQPGKIVGKWRNHRSSDPTSTKSAVGRDKSEKPPYTYICLIAKAIQAQPSQKATLAEIYQYLGENYDFFRGKYTGWKNSIRHNLSIGGCFKKLPKEGSHGSSSSNKVGKGHKWVLGPELAADGRMNRKTRIASNAEALEGTTKLTKNSRGFDKKKQVKSTSPLSLLPSKLIEASLPAVEPETQPISAICSDFNNWSSEDLLPSSEQHVIYPVTNEDWSSDEARNVQANLPIVSATAEQYLPATAQPSAYLSEYLEHTFPTLNPITSCYTWYSPSGVLHPYAQQLCPTTTYPSSVDYQNSQIVPFSIKMEENEYKRDNLHTNQVYSVENVQIRLAEQTAEFVSNNSFGLSPHASPAIYDNYQQHVSAFSYYAGSGQTTYLDAYSYPNSEINYPSSEFCWASHSSSPFYSNIQNDCSAEQQSEDQLVNQINEENNCSIY